MAKIFNENNQDTNLISFVIKEVCMHDKSLHLFQVLMYTDIKVN